MEGHFIGGLWGLIDLRDRRVAGELYDYLRYERYFYELYGFSRLGRGRAGPGFAHHPGNGAGPEAEALIR